MSKIFDKLYIAGTGSVESLSIYTSTASSNLISIESATTSYDMFKIKSYSDTLRYTRDIITTYAGSGATSFNGENVYRTDANFNNINRIAFDNDGNLYASHFYRVSKIDNTTGLVTTIMGTSARGNVSDCIASDVRFYNPQAIVFDNDNNFFVTDVDDVASPINNRYSKILKYTATSSYVNTIYSETGANSTIYSISIDRSTNDLYLSYYANGLIKKLIAPTYSEVISIFTFSTTTVGIDFATSSNTLYVALNGQYYIKKLINGVSENFAGNGSNTTINGVIATMSGLYEPQAVRYYNNEVYICDRFRVRKVDQNGIITTIAGYANAGGFFGEGVSPLYAKLRIPFDLAIYNNELYIADTGNNRVRKITFNTNPYTRTSNATASYLYYIKESNLFSVRGNGFFKLNGGLQLKDINFATASYATNSLLRSDVTNYILQDGYKINSPWFKSTDFAKNGTMFWMEPGYSKTWQAYSYLGDVKKINFTLTFSTNSLISLPLNRDLSFPGSTYSEIYDVILSSSGNNINLPIFKTYSTTNIGLNIDTSGSGLTGLGITLVGRNIIIGTASFRTIP